MNRPTLFETAQKSVSNDPRTKTLENYAQYDAYFIKNGGFAPTTMLEIGVFNGESTKVFAATFPNAKIVALDLALKPIDFSLHPNVSYLQANQTDRPGLERIVRNEFPDGIDFILDDASHVGSFSAITFYTLLPFLHSKGIYAIEDWGTGYWDDWADGGRFQEYPLNFYDNHFPKRLPSHDFGMVGFVKSLVDLTHEAAIKPKHQEAPKHSSRLGSLEFVEGICFARKA